MLAIRLQRAGSHPVDVLVMAAEAADVHRPQVARWLTVHHPFGERHAGATAGRDAKCIEARADEDVSHLRCLPEDEVAIGREALGTIHELLDAGRRERGHALERLLHDRREMVPVGIEQRELEIGRQAAGRPGNRIRLVAAHHEAADLLLKIGEAVRIAQRRQPARHAVDRRS